MRLLMIPLALTLAMAGAAPVFAGVGLPQLATLQVGPHVVTLYNDSPRLLTGRNTITIEIPALPDGHSISFALDGLDGEHIEVPLRQVLTLDGSDSGHGAGPQIATVSPHDTNAGPAANDPRPATDAHASGHPAPIPAMPEHGAAPPAGDQHAVEGPAPGHNGGRTFLARGTVQVPYAGHWHANVVIQQPSGNTYTAEASLAAIDGGPNSLFVVGAGSLMVGFLVYGAIRRRWPTSPTRSSVRQKRTAPRIER